VYNSSQIARRTANGWNLVLKITGEELFDSLDVDIPDTSTDEALDGQLSKKLMKS
jgi:hypothetical protein